MVWRENEVNDQEWGPRKIGMRHQKRRGVLVCAMGANHFNHLFANLSHAYMRDKIVLRAAARARHDKIEKNVRADEVFCLDPPSRARHLLVFVRETIKKTAELTYSRSSHW